AEPAPAAASLAMPFGGRAGFAGAAACFRGAGKRRLVLFDLFECAEHGPEGHEHDLQVEPEREVLDVVVVPLRAVLDRGLAAQAVHLGPAGDPGLDAMPVGVAI